MKIFVAITIAALGVVGITTSIMSSAVPVLAGHQTSTTTQVPLSTPGCNGEVVCLQQSVTDIGHGGHYAATTTPTAGSQPTPVNNPTPVVKCKGNPDFKADHNC